MACPAACSIAATSAHPLRNVKTSFSSLNLEITSLPGELALGLHVEPIHGLFTGVVGRFRDALGSNGDKGTGILREGLGAATATYVIGRIGLTASAGVVGVKTLDLVTKTTSTQTGAQAAFSVGTVF